VNLHVPMVDDEVDLIDEERIDEAAVAVARVAAAGGGATALGQLPHLVRVRVRARVTVRVKG
jgi:hypothetical protein